MRHRHRIPRVSVIDLRITQIAHAIYEWIVPLQIPLNCLGFVLENKTVINSFIEFLKREDDGEIESRERKNELLPT